MTREQHLSLYEEHQRRATAALKEFCNDHSKMEKFYEFKEEYKISNKHYGIAAAMYTKQMKKQNHISDYGCRKW